MRKNLVLIGESLKFFYDIHYMNIISKMLLCDFRLKFMICNKIQKNRSKSRLMMLPYENSREIGSKFILNGDICLHSSELYPIFCI